MVKENVICLYFIDVSDINPIIFIYFEIDNLQKPYKSTIKDPFIDDYHTHAYKDNQEKVLRSKPLLAASSLWQSRTLVWIASNLKIEGTS